MRVVAGIYKHRQLEFKSDEITRPSKDMVKEAIFSIIGDKVIDSIALDLFAGIGSLGIEAISRGSKITYFVDNNKEAYGLLKKNINNLKINNAKTYLIDYLSSFNIFKKDNIKFDLVFLDPPYKKEEMYQNAINNLINNDLLNKDACLILESDKEIDINIVSKKIKNYKYGKTHIKIIWL